MRVLGERDRLADSDAHTLRERGPTRVAGQSCLAGLCGQVLSPVAVRFCIQCETYTCLFLHTGFALVRTPWWWFRRTVVQLRASTLLWPSLVVRRQQDNTPARCVSTEKLFLFRCLVSVSSLDFKLRAYSSSSGELGTSACQKLGHELFPLLRMRLGMRPIPGLRNSYPPGQSSTLGSTGGESMERYLYTVLPLAIALLGLLLVATPRLFVPLPVPLGIAPLYISMLRLPISTADRGSGSVRTKNGAKAVGRLPPKEPTFLNRPSPSFCPQRRVFSETQLFPGEPKVDRGEHMDHFER
jgi:hypothetical protein